MSVQAPPTPTFENLPDQFMFYIRRFVKFCVEILRKCGKQNLPDDAKVTAVVEAIPFDVYVKYVFQIDCEYGKKLEEGDIDTVARVLALCSPFGETTELTKDMETFTTWLRQNEADRKKFFLYWRVITQILKSA
jgi:hypothetical protein